MANRKHEINFRLSDAEYKYLQRNVKGSGLSRSKYVRDKLFSAIGSPLFSYKHTFSDTFMELEILLGRKVIGYVSCHYEKEKSLTQIGSLFVLQAFREMDIEDILLREATDFAIQHQSATIISYPGIDPNCPDKMPPIEQQKAWYESRGYIHDHDVCAIIPCMIKTL